jgi:hypothetical protein
MPPMIFEDIVDTEDYRAIPISQLPHLAVDLTDLNAHLSLSRSKAVLEDLVASPRHVMAALAAVGCLHFEIQRC